MHRTRALILAVCVTLVVVLAPALALAAIRGEHPADEEAHPPHLARLTAASWRERETPGSSYAGLSEGIRDGILAALAIQRWWTDVGAYVVAERERATRAVPVGGSADSTGGTGCAIPAYICARESGGDPTAVNPSSGAGGKYQFMPGTWGGYGGYARAELAPEWVQDQAAAELWAGGAGCSHWSAC